MKKIFLIGLILLAGLNLQAQKITNGSGQLVTDGSGGLLVEPTVLPYPAVLDDGNTEMWYVAESEYMTFYEDSDSITQWADKSGNGYHLNGTNYPRFLNDTVSFSDSRNDQLYIDLDVDSIAAPYTAWVVIKTMHNSDWSKLLNISCDSSIVIQYFGDAQTIRVGIKTVDDNYIEETVVDNTWYIFKIVVNGESSEFQLNNDAASTGDLLNKYFTQLRLQHSAIGLMVQAFKEIIIRSSDDSSSNESIIRTYLNDKYSIY